MLTLKLFGAGQAHYLNRPLPGFPNQHSYYLLCYLIIHRDQPHDRERLATTLWEERGYNDPRKQLRNALWRLRQAFKAVNGSIEDYLFVSYEELAFISKPDEYWLDIKIFEESVTKYLDISAETLTTEQVEHLEQALRLYADDLLDGIYEDWCLYEREWLRKLYLTSLHKLLDYYEAHKNYEQALSYGHKILAFDNVQERVHRRIMRLLWQLGQRNAALLQYRQCVKTLRDELDVPPMLETEQLYQQLRSNQQLTDHAQDTTIPKSIPSDQALAHHALQRLQKLRTIIEEASDEIHQLESLFRQIGQ
ncbi:MAG TPA: BTAD domain-containing putative transcriptional regulator [Anaerolineae bacterium]|nr:BTAD domain-containing putative transcriptional regulator [Anaerolineae bacterium]